MGDFKRSNKFGGGKGNRGFDRGGFGGGGGFRGRGDREERQMFPATCDNCHKQCEVPFKPNGSKPIYCKECFDSMRDESSDSRPKREFGFNSSDSRPRPEAGSQNTEQFKKQLDALNVKVDKILGLLQSTQPQAVKTSEPKFELSVVEKPETMKKAEAKKVEKKPAAKKKVAKKK